MKKEIADRWAEALRSGQYKQGRGCLREGDKHCCLGVLCSILDAPFKIVAGGYTYGDDEHCSSFVLPNSVRFQAGMRTRNGQLKKYALTDLTDLNDGGKSFNEIANIIETHWQEL